MRRLHSKRIRRHAKISDNIINILYKVIPIMCIVVFIIAQNNLLIVKNYVYKTDDLPKSFVGYKIVHISDLRNTSLNVVSKVKKEKPDVIVVTGGYADKKENVNTSTKTINSLAKIAPVYYIYNKEDSDIKLGDNQGTALIDNNVELSTNNKDVNTFIKDNYGKDILKKAESGDEEAKQYVEYISKELSETSGSTLMLGGLDIHDKEENVSLKALDIIGTNREQVSILLNGNIDNIDEICKSHVDMVFFGGTFGTNYISEKYTKGLYGNNGTQLFVSGGVGRHPKTERFLNFPEIQVITLSDGTIANKNPLEKLLDSLIKDVGTIFDNDGGFKKYKETYDNLE